MRVPITGAAGSIATVLTAGHQSDQVLRRLDLRTPGTAFAGPYTSATSDRRAFEGEQR